MSGPRTCVEFEELLHVRLDGALDAARTAEVEQHLRGCPACAALERDLGTVAEGLGLLPAVDVDDAAWERAVTAATTSGGRRRTMRWVAVPALAAAAVLCWALLHLRHHTARGTEPPRHSAPATHASPPAVASGPRQGTPAAADRPRLRSGVTTEHARIVRRAPNHRRPVLPKPSPKQPGKRLQPMSGAAREIEPPPPGPTPDVPEWLSTPEATLRLAHEAPPLTGPQLAEDIAEMRVVLLAAQAEGSPEPALLPLELLQSLGGPVGPPSGAAPSSGDRGRSG